MTAKCEKCELTRADPEAEIWSWVGADGKQRVRCILHLPRSRKGTS